MSAARTAIRKDRWNSLAVELPLMCGFVVALSAAIILGLSEVTYGETKAISLGVVAAGSIRFCIGQWFRRQLDPEEIFDGD